MTLEDWKRFEKYFKPSEFDSPDKPGSGVNMQHSFMCFLYSLREYVKEPLHISRGGGFRTEEYQRKQGSTSGISDHTFGLGVDIKCDNSTLRFSIIRYCIEAGIDRLGIYDRHVHIGCAKVLPSNVLWVGKSK